MRIKRKVSPGGLLSAKASRKSEDFRWMGHDSLNIPEIEDGMPQV